MGLAHSPLFPLIPHLHRALLATTLLLLLGWCWLSQVLCLLSQALGLLEQGERKGETKRWLSYLAFLFADLEEVI